MQLLGSQFVKGGARGFVCVCEAGELAAQHWHLREEQVKGSGPYYCQHDLESSGWTGWKPGLWSLLCAKPE